MIFAFLSGVIINHATGSLPDAMVPVPSIKNYCLWMPTPATKQTFDYWKEISNFISSSFFINR